MNAINLQQKAVEIRKKTLDMIFRAQTSHIGSALSCTEILISIFERADLQKDVLVVSKGWSAAAVYAIQAMFGLRDEKELETYCKEGGLIGLIEPDGKFGTMFAGGSMGMGLPASVGFALSKKLRSDGGKVYCVMSDGELDCGTTWESALIASHLWLDNLVVFIDKNGFQAMGKTEEVLSLEPLAEKWRSFGWKVAEEDGHDTLALMRASAVSTATPLVVIAHTKKGKGVSFMEDDNLWHYWHIDEKNYEEAKKELCS